MQSRLRWPHSHRAHHPGLSPPTTAYRALILSPVHRQSIRGRPGIPRLLVRDLSHQLEASLQWPGLPKMTVNSSRGTGPGIEESNADQDAPMQSQANATVSIPKMDILSPTSTESLLGRTIGDFNLTPIDDFMTSLENCDLGAHPTSHAPADFHSMMTAFSNMLTRDLTHTAAQISSSIHADLKHLGGTE